MAAPLGQRRHHRRIAVVSALVLAVLVVDVVLGGVHPAVLVFVLGFLLAGVMLGARQANLVPVGQVVSSAARRRTTPLLTVGVIAASAVLVSRILGAGRSDLQNGLATVGVGIAAFAVGLSVTALRSLPDGTD